MTGTVTDPSKGTDFQVQAGQTLTVDATVPVGTVPAEVEAMVSTLAQWIESQNEVRSIIGHAGQSQLDEQTLERLRSRGYLGGSSQ